MHNNKMLVAIALLSILAFMPAATQAVSVDMELALLVDVSGSISGPEYTTQMNGYIGAFNSSAVYNKVGAGSGIAVTMVQWSSSGSQSQVAGWTLITDQASCEAFALALGSVIRASAGSTAPGSAINFSTPLFAENGYEGTRLVMDVSGDGIENQGADTSDARDDAAAAGIIINGLTIDSAGSTFIRDWYVANAQTGAGSFTIGVDSFDDFQPAVERKIITEIGGGVVPEPLTMAGLFIGVTGLVGYVRKRRMA